MTTESGKSLISYISIENTFICSDHFPLCVNIACDISPISTTCNVVDNKTYNMPKWNQVCSSDKCKFESCTLKLSRDIVIPSEALLCRDAECEVHRNNYLSPQYIPSLFKMASTWRYTLVCLDGVMDISTTD